jgi:hypothetical protein
MARERVGGQEMIAEGRFIRVARLAAEQYDEVHDPTATIGALRTSALRPDLFTFEQMLPDRTPLHSYTFEWDNLAAVAVSSFDYWFGKQIDGKTRNMVRRAEKSGVVVREVPFDAALVRGIKGVWDESPVRQGKAFWHYGKPLEAVERENATFLDRSVFIGAFLDETLIGFAKVVRNERGTQAGLMQIVSMIGHRDKAPTNALVAQAVRSCAERGIPYLFYSRFAFGRRQRDSLSDFKENNGFQRLDLPRYYVPLTAKGRLALRLGLHHGKAIDYLPEPVQEALRSLRNAWTVRRLQRPQSV